MIFTDIEIYRQDISMVLGNGFPWSRLDGKNVLVTGATGLLGSFLTDVLMSNPDRKYHVWICSRNETGARQRFSKWWHDESFHFFRQNLEEPIQSETDFNYIFHAAGNSFPAAFAENPVGTLKGTVIGTENLLNYSLCHNLERMLYVSSGEVYGDGNVQTWKEQDSGYVNVTSPRACYPTAKRAAENLCVCYHSQYGLDVTIVRPSHIYGATFTSSDNRAYAQFIRNVIAGQDIVLKSDGSPKRGYCYVADCVSAMLYVLFYGEAGQAYNISNDSSFVSIRELAGYVAGTESKKVIVGIPDNEEKKGYSTLKYTRLDSSKLQSLGWNPETALDEGVARCVDIVRQL